MSKMINVSKNKIYILIFISIMVVYLVYMMYKFFTKPEQVEPFEEKQTSKLVGKEKSEEKSEEKDKSKLTNTEPVDPSSQTDSESDAYQNRMYVMKMFEAMFMRKPTIDEIGTYSSFGSEKAILNAILADYDKLEKQVEQQSIMSALVKSPPKENSAKMAEPEHLTLDDLDEKTTDKAQDDNIAMYDKQMLHVKLTTFRNSYDDLVEFLSNQM
jgi:hypothetical protein